MENSPIKEKKGSCLWAIPLGIGAIGLVFVGDVAVTNVLQQLSLIGFGDNKFWDVFHTISSSTKMCVGSLVCDLPVIIMFGALAKHSYKKLTSGN
jgi:hypothetical protein